VLGLPIFAGMNHSLPFIGEVVAEARAAGIERLIGLPLAPHYARMSLGGYERAMWKARPDAGTAIEFIPGFHDHPAFVEAALLRRAQPLPPHRGGGRPHDRRLLESCRLVAEEMELPPWEFAFQSASSTGEPWLGPDLPEAIE
jgi:ferrochelatase